VSASQILLVTEKVKEAVHAMAPPPQPDLEVLRMKYRPVGCWAPMCVLCPPNSTVRLWRLM